MSVLTNVILRNIQEIEEKEINKVSKEIYRQKFHIMPPVGWLNDPNGLCYFKGEYHVFFQYCPFDANGGLKVWGHYTSKNLTEWEYKGVSFVPDCPYDCHGVYSGSAYVENDKMHIFYTGNVKYDGDFDYINNGRGAYTIKSESVDGINFSYKKCLMSLDDMPKDYTCHIRDPKVYKENDEYLMVIGGRKKENRGAVLLYSSNDLENWTLKKEIMSDKPFGYMWECPDVLNFGDKKFLSMSPQGLKREEYRFQNVYQSGYALIENDIINTENFKEWDYGFDFYAPQTFTDEKGRTILIGWVGVPDSENEYTNPTTKRGWQHNLTLLRELKYKNDKILQYPVSEFNVLRKDFEEIQSGETKTFKNRCFDCEIKDIYGKININICDSVNFDYDNGVAILSLTEKAGYGRKVRKAKIDNIYNLRVIADVSVIEIYVNDGEYVFTTRFYTEINEYYLDVNTNANSISTWELNSMKGI